MASAALEKVRTERECSICLNVFTNPVTLDCGHSFCLNCLSGYVETHPTAAARKVLPCSICRHETKVPCPEQPMKDWGKQLTPSFTIKNLSKEIKTTQSTHENDDNCFLCLDHGERTRAVLWCQECEISLCQRCSRTHEILPGTKDHDVTELTEKAKRKKPFKILCSKHNEPIKFYCRECKRCACGSCGFLEHRKCDDIASVQSVLPEMTSVIAENHQTILERMKDKEQEVSFLTSQLEFVKSKENATLTKISDADMRMMILLQEKYQKDIDEVKKTVQPEKTALESSIKVAKQDVEMHREHAAVLNEVLKSGDEKDILKTFEVCQTRNILTNDDRDCPVRDHVSDLDFRICEENIQQLISSTGQLEVTKTDGMLYRTRLVKQLDTQIDEDNKVPMLMDIISLRVGNIDTVLVTDANNKSVKCFYSGTSTLSRLSSSKIMHSVCRLEGNPRGISKLTDNRIMVSVEGKARLVTLSVTPELVMDEVIQTQKQYVALCMLNSGLMAAGCYRGVDLLNVSGDTVTRVKSLAEGVFTRPYYLHFSVHDNNIIVSDRNKHSVKCLTPEGSVKWSYTSPFGPIRPYGVTSTRTGDVVVVDSHAKKVIVLTRSGMHKADILSPATSEIRDPSAVHCDDQGHLYVAEVTGRVGVYKLTEI